MQQANGFQQQIVKIERVGIAQRLFVILEEGGQRFHLVAGGIFIEVGRALFAIFGVADARERRAVLHEFLLIQSEAAIGGLDNAELIFVIVDGEAAGEAGTDTAQRIAIAAQQADAKRVERGNERSFVDSAVFEQVATRSRISEAALFVKVTARIADGGTCFAVTICAIRCVMTRVLPLPAPARINNGPSV